MRAIFLHELRSYFNSMVAYVYGAFLLIFTGIGAMVYNINASVANFEYVLSFISLIFIVLIPILTMRVISEERKQKTDQLLYSLPISAGDVIVGKFLALTVVFLVPIVLISVYPIFFAQYGEVYLPTSYGSILAFVFLGMALLSIGMFISSLTESQGVAAGITVVVLLFSYYCTTLADYASSTAIGTLITSIIIFVLLGVVVRILTKSNFFAVTLALLLSAAVTGLYFFDSELLEGILPDVMRKISLFERFYTFVNGVFDVTALIYYLSVIVFFLFLSVQSLEKRRYNG